MKKHLMVKMIALFAVILLVFVSAGAAKAEKPYKAITYYVNDDATGADNGASWQDAFTDLQSALDAAVSGDKIWVAAGTYKPHADDRNVSFSLKSGIKIYGGFEGWEKALRERSLDPSLTVLSGDIGTPGDDTDNSYHVVYADGVTDAVLDGFTVTGGRGDGDGDYKKNQGAGMYNNNSVLTVSNCVFSDNQAKTGGGGMYNNNSALTVSDCIFSGNQVGSDTYRSSAGGGGMYNSGCYDWESQTIVSNCIFTENGAYVTLDLYGGGGMYNYDSSPVIESCTFEQNWSKWGGGMCNRFAKPTVTNCVFNANNAYMGGGMHNIRSGPEITNCIFNANWATQRGGGIHYHEAGGSIKNSTFYRNGWRYLDTCKCAVPYTFGGGAICIERPAAALSITNVIFDSNGVNGNGGVGGAVLHTYSSSPLHPRLYTSLESCLFYGNIKQSWQYNEGLTGVPVDDDLFAPDSTQANCLFGLDPFLVDPAGGDFHLRYDSPCVDAGFMGLKHGNLRWPPLPVTDFEGDKRIIDGDGDGTPAVDIGADEYVHNLPDLGVFLQDLVDSGELDVETAARLLAYVDDAQAALEQEEKETAISILNDLIADARASLGDTETGQLIEIKTKAVIEEI